MNFIKNQTIRTKLYLGFGAVLAVVLVMFAIGAFSPWWMNQETVQARLKRSIDSTRFVRNLRSQMLRNRASLATFLLSGTTPDLDEFNKGRQDFAGFARQVLNEPISEDQKTGVNAAVEAERNWHKNEVQPLIDKRRDAGRSLESFHADFLSRQHSDWDDNIDKALLQAETSSQAEIDAERKQDEDAGERAIHSLMYVGIFALLLGCAIAYFTAKSITEPVKQLMKVARDIGESGDLEQSFVLERKDEIGELAATFQNMIHSLKDMAAITVAVAGGDLTASITPRSKNDTLMLAFSCMTDSLRSMVKSVRDSATQVATGSSQVADASDNAAKVNVQASSAIDEVTSTMHEMSVNVQNMVKNTQTQAISVSETSASIDQMVASIQRVADTSKVLLDISQRSREEVHQGIATMEKTLDGLGRINGSIQTAGQIIDALGKRADSIDNIVEVIDDLAEQTNLLALNAAIEAARAGEHGAGFAVVADEVRKLAEKSAASAKEISDLIASIQNEARQAVDKMEKSTTIVNEGLSLGNDLQAALRKISNVVTEVYKFAQEIGAATSEQSHGSTQIAKATTRLNEITHEINSSVEEQAAGAQAVVRAMEKMRELIAQTTVGSTELAASAEQMSKMSRNLLETMDRFVLEGGANGHGSSPSRGRADFEAMGMSAMRSQ
jgi:methyl-accepting chemotaxis protein